MLKGRKGTNIGIKSLFALAKFGKLFSVVALANYCVKADVEGTFNAY